MVTSFLDIIDEKLLHIITTNANTVLLISLTAILSKRVSEVVMEWRWQFSSLVLTWVVIESLGGMEKWPSVTIIFFLSEQVVSVVGNLFVERFVHGEAVALGECEHLLRRGVIDCSVVFVRHIY